MRERKLTITILAVLTLTIAVFAVGPGMQYGVETTYPTPYGTKTVCSCPHDACGCVCGGLETVGQGKKIDLLCMPSFIAEDDDYYYFWADYDPQTEEYTLRTTSEEGSAVISLDIDWVNSLYEE
ncbi:hypothetical protein JXM67_15585 [candidate division WOR-3 bacterium]|nr:hypothetical protein [candidate division WOR-3 bacterium]